MSEREPDVPFRKVLDLCGRNGFQLMRIVGTVRIFWNPRRFKPSDSGTWCSVEVLPNGCVKRSVFAGLQRVFQDYSERG